MRLLLAVSWALGGCQPPSPPSPEGLPARQVARLYLPSAEGQLERLCARGNADRVSRFFCRDGATPVRSLLALERGLELEVGRDGTHFTLTANSTAVTTRFVNPLNPRAILFDGVPKARFSTREFLALGFTRGEQLVELVTRDEVSHELRFFVVAFEQACSSAGCTTAQLLTPDLESEWTATTVFQDVDLENTALDCLRCHQPSGPGTPRILRMQELRFPWTHFLAPATETTSGAQLASDFLSAHPRSEVYAGIPAALIEQRSDPNMLSSLLAQEGSGVQPNEFEGFPISLELSSTGESATWKALFETARRGEAIPVPYYGLEVSDPTRQAEVAAAYRAALADPSLRSSLPDLRELHTEEAERATSIRPWPHATGREVLTQMCQQCHHRALNPALSRARFDVSRLDELSREEKDLAISRLGLSDDDPQKMPPVLTGALSPEELSRAVDALRE